MAARTSEAAEERKAAGNRHYKAEEYEAAMECYGEAIALDGENAAYYGNRAAAAMAMDRFRSALEDSLVSVKISPDYVKGYMRASKCNIALGHLAEAKSVLERCPDREAVRADLINVANLTTISQSLPQCIESKQYSRARSLALQLMQQMPQSDGVQIVMVEALIGLKQYVEAATMGHSLVQHATRNPKALYAGAKALNYAGRHAAAIKVLQEGLRLDPDNRICFQLFKQIKKQEKLKTKGNDAFKEGRLEEAVDVYSEALQVDPSHDTFNAVLFCNRAAAKMKQGKYTGALEDCEQALQLDETYTKALKRRAECRLQTEDYEGAVRDYKTLYESDRSDRELRQRLQEAERELEKSKRKDYYKILGVDRDADERVIKKAYRKMALQFHPDKVTGTDQDKADAEAQFKEVGEAYNVLSDPEKRRRFDAGVDVETGMPFSSGGAGHGGMDDVFQAFFQGGHPMGGRQRGGFEFHFG